MKTRKNVDACECMEHGEKECLGKKGLYNPHVKDSACTCIDEHYCGKSKSNPPHTPECVHGIGSDYRCKKCDNTRITSAMVAAPDLLEALKDFHNLFYGTDMTTFHSWKENISDCSGCKAIHRAEKGE